MMLSHKKLSDVESQHQERDEEDDACREPSTPKDIPAETHLTTPMLPTKPYRALGLLCTPRATISENRAMQEYEEHLADGESCEIQALLMMQKNELSKVVDAFERRLLSFHRAKLESDKHALSSTYPLPCRGKYADLALSQREPVANSGIPSAAEVEPVKVPVAAYVEPGKEVRVDAQRSPDTAGKINFRAPSNSDQPQRSLRTSRAIESSFVPSQLLFDFKLVKGWAEHSKSMNDKLTSGLVSWMGRDDKIDSQTALGHLVHSKGFGAISCAIIALHAILTGAATDHSARNPGKQDSQFYEIADLIFLLCYSVELLLRIAAEGCRFLLSGWNVFDFVLIGCDAVGHVYNAMTSDTDQTVVDSLVAARVTRMLRVLRAFRLLRLMHVFRELRMMVRCVLACGKMAVWVFLLLIMVIYIFGVYLTGQVSAIPIEDTQLDEAFQDILRLRFGTMTDACLSLFMAISGGISWVEFADPLISLHWTNGIVVPFFIFFTLLVMLNIITGVFVDGAVSAGRSDEEEVLQDIIEDEHSNLRKIRALFEKANGDGDNHLSYEELETTLTNPDMRILFKSIGIGVHQVRGLWKLLDIDGSGTLTLDEFITGCMRLRESSSFVGIDLCTLMYENKRMMQKWKTFTRHVDQQFLSLHECITTLSLPS